MGLPQVLIEFKAKAETAIARSQNGIVALILFDDTKSGPEYTSYSYNYEKDIVKARWTTANLDYLNKAFMGHPKRVIVERVSSPEDGYDTALARLKNKAWNWLAIPELSEDEVKEIADWIIMQRDAKKTFKAVLPNYAANNEGVVNLTTTDIKVGAKTYTAADTA